MKTEKYLLSVWSYEMCMFKCLELPKTKINEILRQLNISLEMKDFEYLTELRENTTEFPTYTRTIYTYTNCGCDVEIAHLKCKEGYQFKK